MKSEKHSVIDFEDPGPYQVSQFIEGIDRSTVIKKAKKKLFQLVLCLNAGKKTKPKAKQKVPHEQKPKCPLCSANNR